MYNKLSIFCYVDKEYKDSEIKAFKKEMERNYPVNIIIKEFDGATVEWDERNEKMYMSDEYNAKMAKPVYDKYFHGVDLVGIFIDPKNWKNATTKLYGTQYGKKHSDYYVFNCKLRNDYEDTGEHEVLHAIDNYIKLYLGINIEPIFGVDSFDNDVVHGKEYWKKGYFYDTIWDKLSLVLSMAIAKKRSQNAVLNLTSVVQRVKEARYKASESIKEPEVTEETIWDKLINFKKKEFNYPDKMDIEFLLKIDLTRTKSDFPFKNNSDWRPDGSHSSGQEMDIDINGATFYQFINMMYSKGKGALIMKFVKQNKETLESIFGKDKQCIAMYSAIDCGITRIGIYNGHMHFGTDPNSPQHGIWTGTSE